MYYTTFITYNICVLSCMGSADLGVLCGDFVDGRIYHSSLGRREQLIPVFFAGDFAKPDNFLQAAVI